jgi:Ni,Fe-hydrogenase I small subunit
VFKFSPTYAGHGCLGCSEPHFWDKGQVNDTTFRSFYDVLE